MANTVLSALAPTKQCALRGTGRGTVFHARDATDSGRRPTPRYGQNGQDIVVGRKNRYGSRSKRGTEVAALFYTLIESAKLAGVEPKAYLLAAAKAALQEPGKVLLPSDYAATLL